MKIALTSLAALALATTPAAARPITPDDLVGLSRLSDPAVSADSRWAVWQQRETDLAANKGRFDLWKLDLTRKGGNDEVWRVAIGGGAAEQVTKGARGISGFLLSPAGDKLLVWADKKPHAPNLAPAMAKKDPLAGTARTYDKLFVRHWDTWASGDRSQLFVIPIAGGKAAGDGVAIAKELEGDAPSKPFGGREEIAWAPDGRTVYFALREAGRIEATSTNLDIFAAPADGSAAPVNLTADNDGTDTSPAVSPNGKWLAWAAMKRPTYEADRLVIQLREIATGKTRVLTDAWDRSAESIAWAQDGKSLLVTTHDHMDVPLFRIDVATGAAKRLTPEGSVSGVVATKTGAVYALDRTLAPADLHRIDGAKITKLTSVNAAKLAGIDMPTMTRFSFAGADGDTVWGYAVKPAGLAAGAKVPVAYLIHGGPQGSFTDGWSYRWNPAVFAGAGYGAVTVDFHGSIGYGQAFTDAITRQWGGKPFEDVKAGLAAATAKFAWLDGDRACVLGASYGGYMVNWIAGNWPDRFKCIVQHDGVFDARAMAYETEELWFDEWEHGGTYYDKPESYEQWNPVNHVAKWQTPMLVITGEKDFRIPYTQGLAAFTALQRRDIPSRLIVFPDENHWVLKPRNSRQWYGEVLGWLGKWTGAATN